MISEQHAYIAFNLTDNIGFATVDRLAAQAGSVAAAWDAYPHKTSRTGGEIDIDGELAAAKRFGVTILTPADALYPPLLTHAPGRPLALYVKGDVRALARTSVALIGTRRATSYGLNIANHLAYDLAQSGLATVSGLAIGIDAEAHRGTLDANGITIGVLGSALDCFYPEENRALAREIVRKGGAVVSEFPFGRPADRTTFPIRNHVVAALASGVVAIEAPYKSGTLITTSIAADLGRPVMAVPARIDSRMSAGCLDLIRKGATLVRNANDVLEALGNLVPTPTTDSPQPEDARDPNAPPYSVEEALIMGEMENEGQTMDELAHKTKLPIGVVSSTVMTLRIKGFVRFLPGARVALPR